MAKLKEKEKAIKLRKRGLSYNEILKEVPAAKSTLSLWLRSVALAKRQRQRLTEKRLAAGLRGALKRKEQRKILTEKIKKRARSEIKNITKRDLWMIGIVLYWGEGTKQKEHNVSQDVTLGNSDSRIIKIFLDWLLKICKISKKNINFRILLHETAKNRLPGIKKYWSKITGFPIDKFQKVTWKKHKIGTNRKNIKKTYHGLLEVKVKKSTNLNRKIDGWVEGIYKNCGVV